MSLKCPRCGAALVAHLGVSLGALDDASPDASDALRQDAQEVVDLDLEVQNPSPNGARTYNQGYTREFELWWKVYPIRKDKRKAAKAWRNAVARIVASNGASREDAMAQLIAGASRYAKDPNRSETYTKYAEGWLNGDRWLDDPLPEREVAGRRPEPRRPLTVAEEIERSRE